MKTKKKEIICSSIIILIVFAFFGIFKRVKINGNALSPNYNNGDKWLVNKLTYNFTEPKRGDVIMFEYYKLPNFKYMGRIIGLPNENLMIKNGEVFIDGTKLQEEYLTSGITTKTTNPVKEERISEVEGKLVETTDKKLFKEGVEILIPENQYFVLGDNRENSYDSRSLGFVRKEDIDGYLHIKY